MHERKIMLMPIFYIRSVVVKLRVYNTGNTGNTANHRETLQV